MKSQIVWIPWDGPGMEHLLFSQSPNGSVKAESVVAGVASGLPFTLRYCIKFDTDWRVRQFRIEALQGSAAIELHSDGNGTWTNPDGEALPERRRGLYRRPASRWRRIGA